MDFMRLGMRDGKIMGSIQIGFWINETSLSLFPCIVLIMVTVKTTDKSVLKLDPGQQSSVFP